MPNRRRTLKPDTKLAHGGPAAHKIASMLTDQSLSYGEIAKRVKDELPGARTSSRSVASVASRLRRDGYKVPDRRFNTHQPHAA